ncbi:hypothetical protein Ancab_021787 [Ancistrocladus abbreviatus]
MKKPSVKQPQPQPRRQNIAVMETYSRRRRRCKSQRPSTPFLPYHMMEQILVWLPIKSLLRFTAVCREWYSLISIDSHFQTATLHHHQQSSQRLLIAWTQPISRVGEPCTVMTTFNYESRQTGAYCPVLDHLPCYNWGNYPFVHWKRLQFLGSCNGLVAMYSGDGKFCLWNPLTRKYKLITCARGKHMSSSSRAFYTAGLCYDVSSDEYKVVYMGLDRDIHVQSFKTGESKLVKCSFHPSALLLTTVSMAIVNGAPHWVATIVDHVHDPVGSPMCRTVLYFDQRTEEFLEMPLPNIHGCSHSDIGIHGLGVLNGQLCVLLSDGQLCYGIWVMKEFGLLNSWTNLAEVSLIPQSPIIHAGYLTFLCLTETGSIWIDVLTYGWVVCNHKEGTLTNHRLIYKGSSTSCALITSTPSIISPNRNKVYI